MKDGPTYTHLLPTLAADVWDTYQTVIGLSALKGHAHDTARNVRVTEFYLSGLLKPHYPVPSTLVAVKDCGLADGLFEYYPDNAIKWGIYDVPLPDGSRVID